MDVRAKVTHTQPGTQEYRREGEVFDHQGKLYKHVEAVQPKPQRAAATLNSDEANDTGAEK